MPRNYLFLPFVLFFISCNSDEFAASVDSVFKIYGGEVRSSTEIQLSTESGKSYSHNISVKWPDDFPDDLVEPSLLNIACVYYQNLPAEEKEELEFIQSKLEDQNSNSEMKVSKNQLLELEELYPISSRLFEAMNNSDSLTFHELMPSKDSVLYKSIVEALNQISSTSGRITEVFFKGALIRNQQVVITHMYYSENGSVYNGIYKIDRETKQVTEVELTR